MSRHNSGVGVKKTPKLHYVIYEHPLKGQADKCLLFRCMNHRTRLNNKHISSDLNKGLARCSDTTCARQILS